MARIAKCKGNGCEFFRKYYGTQKVGTGYMPDFKTVDLRCVHPKIYTPKTWGSGGTDETPGIPVMSIRACPDSNESVECDV